MSSSLPLTLSQATLLARQLQAEIHLRKSQNRLIEYRPYAKQKLFHDLGATHRERLLAASNRFGKTECGAFEMAIHLTGRYPDWWGGKRFDKPVRAWAAGITGESTRDVVQAKLFGPPDRRESWGTGAIPHECIGDIATGRGIANAIDMASIRHVSGGWSSLGFKTYEKGREKWQGASLEVLWMDEEPSDRDIYTEGLTRTGETGGIAYMTCTPLLGMSDVMRSFFLEKNQDKALVQATLMDAEHLSQEERDRMVRSWPAHEREAREKGIPQLGSGKIFPVTEESITIQAFAIPEHWPEICGLDFGWDHPSAGAKLAWDRDSDCIYVTNAHRMRQQTPLLFSSAVKPWGEFPWAWPHDGLQHDKGSGEQLAKQYRDHGLKMLGMHATFEDGSNGVEAGIQDMLDRMQTGRWKVFSHLREWFEEFNLYHRKDGLVVKENDDLISASRYAFMMRRFATTRPKPKKAIPQQRRAGTWMSN